MKTNRRRLVSRPQFVATVSRVSAEAMESRVLWSVNPFTPGDVVVYRVGTGSAALGSSATAVFLDEYTPGGTLVQSIAMPTAASLALTAGANGATNYNEDLDFDGDGRVFNTDYSAFLADFGSTRIYSEPQS